MSYSPKQDLKRVYFISLCFMLPGMVTFMMAASSPVTVVNQTVGLILCSLGIFIMYRYALTTFHYVIEGGELTVHKVTGKRINAVARVALRQCRALTKIGENTLKGRRFRGGKYKYTVNIAPKDQYLLTFADGEDDTAIILECEPTFASALSALLPDNAEIKL